MQSTFVLLVAIFSTIATASPRPEKGLFFSTSRVAGDDSSLLVQQDDPSLQNPKSVLEPQQFQSNEVAFALTPDNGVISEVVPNLTQPPAGVVDPSTVNLPGLVQASSGFNANIGQDAIGAPAFTIADAQPGYSVPALDDVEIKLQIREDSLKKFEDTLLREEEKIPLPNLTDPRPLQNDERNFAHWAIELTQDDNRSKEKEAAYARVTNKDKQCCHDVTTPAVAGTGKHLVDAISVRQSQYMAWQTRLDLYAKRLDERRHMLELKKRANNRPDDDDDNWDVLGDWMYAWHISASHRSEDLIYWDQVAPEVNLACCKFFESMERDKKATAPLPYP